MPISESTELSLFRITYSRGGGDVGSPWATSSRKSQLDEHGRPGSETKITPSGPGTEQYIIQIDFKRRKRTNSEAMAKLEAINETIVKNAATAQTRADGRLMYVILVGMGIYSNFDKTHKTCWQKISSLQSLSNW